jgi:hypothetical protein
VVAVLAGRVQFRRRGGRLRARVGVVQAVLLWLLIVNCNTKTGTSLREGLNRENIVGLDQTTDWTARDSKPDRAKRFLSS